MSYVVLDSCTACGACLLTCPEHAFVVGLPLTVRDDRCSSCGECVEVCPADAVLELPAAPPAAPAQALIYASLSVTRRTDRQQDVDHAGAGARQQQAAGTGQVAR